MITAILRSYAEEVCQQFKDRILEMVCDDRASVRDGARFLAKKHLQVSDFPGFYKEHISKSPSLGAIIGLGETGGTKEDYTIISQYAEDPTPKKRLAAMTAMWYLSKENSVKYVIDSLESDVPRIRKTARLLLNKSKMPTVFYEMRNRLNDFPMTAFLSSL